MLRKHNEAKDVVYAVSAHHAEVEPQSLYDVLINACDTLSASRPGARSETTELYLKRLEQLEREMRYVYPGSIGAGADDVFTKVTRHFLDLDRKEREAKEKAAAEREAAEREARITRIG